MISACTRSSRPKQGNWHTDADIKTEQETAKKRTARSATSDCRLRQLIAEAAARDKLTFHRSRSDCQRFALRPQSRAQGVFLFGLLRRKMRKRSLCTGLCSMLTNGSASAKQPVSKQSRALQTEPDRNRSVSFQLRFFIQTLLFGPKQLQKP